MRILKKLLKILLFLVLIVVLLFIGLWASYAYFVSTEFPELVESPEVGKWYAVPTSNAVCANGEPLHGLYRKGKENKLMVYFYGGGVSIDPYMAARGFSVSPNEGFYSDVDPHYDYIVRLGICNQSSDNPFKDWSIVAIPYFTGDFHIGTGDYPYVSLEGKNEVLRHHGFTNYRSILEKMKPYVGNPETLLITGSSAGGFGASLLADDVMDQFPETQNVTVFVDSSVLLTDKWPEVARDMWKAPEEIANSLVSDNIMVDGLKALYQHRGNKVKILFGCSARDVELSKFQVYLNEGHFRKLAIPDAKRMQQNLKKTVADMQASIPGCGIFIWDNFESFIDKGFTFHAITSIPYIFFEDRNGYGSIPQWLINAINGDIQTHGLELLDKEIVID